MFKYDERTALVVVDIQNDFALPTGALSVKDGDKIIPYVNSLIKEMQEAGATIVYSMDWHPANHMSFKEYDGMWPSHCVQGTNGARLHNELALDADYNELEKIFSKATTPYADSYSAFGGVNGNGVSLENYLRSKNVVKIVVVGLALDYCVKATALDAQNIGFLTMVDIQGTKAVFPETNEATIAELVNSFVWILE